MNDHPNIYTPELLSEEEKLEAIYRNFEIRFEELMLFLKRHNFVLPKITNKEVVGSL